MAEPRDHADAARLAVLAGTRLLALRDEALVGSHELGDIADRKANEAILGGLRQAHPGDAILSEESPDDDRRLAADRVWIVDPLDGTREYVQLERTDWAVHVALWERGAGITAAAVALPARDELYATGTALHPPPVSRGLRITVSRSRPPAFTEELAFRLGADVIPIGSAGAKAMAVLTGEVDVYVHAGGQHQWDSAAPVGVVLEAGLHASRIDGSPLVYNEPDVLVPDLLICRAELAPRLLDELAALTG
ncbi:MAG: 3(2), 5-bisphosphate nucleotidase [Acidimicrobiaceae bacterium]|jgi:3'(2'), 5'-bisphosphate nucleotidase|nr:3(2), 5-bisphosphate nucleotidase [Acidimicrobiaceae bacterium]